MEQQTKAKKVHYITKAHFIIFCWENSMYINQMSHDYHINSTSN